MQAIGPILMGAQAVVGAVGSISAASQNASVLRAQAAEEQSQSIAEQSQIRRAARAAMGDQVMRAAESGFNPGYGTALVELEESLINRELDIMTSKRNAGARAAGLQQQARYAKRQGYFGAAASILQGASSIYGAVKDQQAAGK